MDKEMSFQRRQAEARNNLVTAEEWKARKEQQEARKAKGRVRVKAIEDALKSPPWVSVGTVTDRVGPDEFLPDEPTTYRTDRPQQGKLFPNTETRERAAEEAGFTVQVPDGDKATALKAVKESISMGAMPPHLIRALGRPITVDPKWGPRGSYIPSTKEVNIRQSHLFAPGWGSNETLTHELGHFSDNVINGNNMVVGDGRPDPRAEGVADGMMERYSPGSRGSYRNRFELSRDNVVYNLNRVHFRETGEAVPLERGWRGVPKNVHRIMSNTPEAFDALNLTHRNTAVHMAHDYQRSRQVATQPSLFPDMAPDQPIYDLPEGHSALNLSDSQFSTTHRRSTIPSWQGHDLPTSSPRKQTRLPKGGNPKSVLRSEFITSPDREISKARVTPD